MKSIARLFASLATILVAAFLVAAPAAAEDVGSADARAVQTVIDSQIAAFKAHDHATAYSFAAPGIRQIFPTVDSFMNMVIGGYQPVYDPQSYHFGRNIAVEGDIRQEVIITDKDGKQWQAVYTLQRQEDGSWKVTGVKLNPYTGTSV